MEGKNGFIRPDLSSQVVTGGCWCCCWVESELRITCRPSLVWNSTIPENQNTAVNKLKLNKLILPSILLYPLFKFTVDDAAVTSICSNKKNPERISEPKRFVKNPKSV